MRKTLSVLALVSTLALSACANVGQSLMAASGVLQGAAVAVNSSQFMLQQASGLQPNPYVQQPAYYVPQPYGLVPQQYAAQPYNPQFNQFQPQYQQPGQYVAYAQQPQQYVPQAQPIFNGYNNAAFAQDEAAREAANAARDTGGQPVQQVQYAQQPQYMQPQYPQYQQMPQQQYVQQPYQQQYFPPQMTNPQQQYNPYYQQGYQQNYQQPYQPYQGNTNNDAYLDYLNGTIAYDPATDTTDPTPLLLNEDELDTILNDVENDSESWINLLVDL